MTNRLLEQVTLEGRIPAFNPTLNDAKLKAADKILEGMRRGDSNAVAKFKEHMGARYGETLTTGDDFVHAFAQLAAFEIVDEWEAEDRNWAEVIPTETVSSFTSPTTYYVNTDVKGFSRPQDEPNKPGDIVPIVPEGTPYPSFVFAGEAAESNGIHKAGGQYSLTFEKIVSDPIGLVPIIPKLIKESLLNRESYDAWSGLVSFINIASNHLKAGTTLDGEAVVADSPLTRNALSLALSQARKRKIRKKVVRVSTYDLLVPVGEKEQAEWLINTLTLTGIDETDSTITKRYATNGWNPLSGIRAVVETEYLTGTKWALVPSKNAVSGPNKFYSYGQLVGHVGPELRIQNLTGSYIGGGNVPPFEGSFDTDSAAFRGRIIGGGLGWNAGYAVFSDGDGS